MDIYHTTYGDQANMLLHNNGDGSFTNTTTQAGVQYNDGAMDLFAAGHIDKYRPFKNNNCPGSFLNIILVGVESNPNGIGAQADVWVSGQRISRNVLPDGGFHDNSDLKLHFGLDGAYSADSLIISWPSGIIQKMYDINANQFLTVIEDESTGTTDGIIESTDITVFPNPVSSTTHIRYSILDTRYSKLCVYDSFGRKIQTLVEEIQAAGTYTISFNAEGLQAGVYFYRLISGGQVVSGKVIIQ
ncbi:MAG: ASPIC/UnbV domain-containing protein [Bacteroidota bacterium]